MNIFAATRQLGFVTKLFAAAKLNLEDFIKAEDESALAAHIEAQRTASVPTVSTSASPASTTVTVDNTATETALLTAAGIAIAAGQTPAQALAAHVAAGKETAGRLGSFVTALNGVGIKVAADAKPEQLTKALTDRISTRAGEELAKRGVGTVFVTETPSADPVSAPSAAAKSELKGLAKVQAAFTKQSAARS